MIGEFNSPLRCMTQYTRTWLCVESEAGGRVGTCARPILNLDACGLLTLVFAALLLLLQWLLRSSSFQNQQNPEFN